MMGVNDGIADLKRHLASTPSAEGYLTTARTTDKMPPSANMQVNAHISSTRQSTRQAFTAADAVFAGCYLGHGLIHRRRQWLPSLPERSPRLA